MGGLETHSGIKNHSTSLEIGCGTREREMSGTTDSRVSNLGIWVVTHHSWGKIGSDLRRDVGLGGQGARTMHSQINVTFNVLS